MTYKKIEEIISVLDSISQILGVKRISNGVINNKWNEYKNTGCCFISLDISNNDLHDFKCYLRQDSVTKSNQYDEKEMSSYFEWGEYSFSLIHTKNINPNLRKIIHRIKPMPIENAKEYVYNLFSSANASNYIDDFLQLADIITKVTMTNRYPILGGGFAVNKTNEEIEEIKLYYQLLHFNNCFDQFGDNLENIKEKSAQELINILCDAKMKKVFFPVFEEFTKNEIPLSLFAINKNIHNNLQVNKFYFREGSNRIDNPSELINSIHKILFVEELDVKYIESINTILTFGFNQGEICIATDGVNSMLKIYFYA